MKDNQLETFISNCKYLGLKKLTEGYQSLIDNANNVNMGFFDFISHIVALEAEAKKERSISYRVSESRLPQPYKLIGDFDFSFQPTIKKSLIMDLATMNFIRQRESILLVGNCGTGKSHLAQSLALIACSYLFRVYYTTCSNMLNDLNTGVYEKTLTKRLLKYVSPDLLVIDEMGHDRLELEVTKEAHLLFKVIDERYKQKKSLIFTTNVKEQDWAEYLGDPISTSAILDRIFHRSIKIEILGNSYREYEGDKLQQKYQKQ